MSDLNGEVSTDQGDGHPEQVSEGTTEGAEPQYVTLEQAEALIGKASQRTLEEATRKSQSLFDKGERRITDNLRKEFGEIDRTIAKLRESGIEIDDAQVEAIKQRSMLTELGGEVVQEPRSPGESTEGSPDGRKSTPDQPVNPVLALAYQMMQEAETMIERDDPEMSLIKFQSNTVTDFINSVGEAINAKKERLGQSSEDAGEDAGEDDVTDTEERAAKIASRNPGTGLSQGKKTSKTPTYEQGKAMDYFKKAYDK